jgi:hypothetical protein
MKYLYSLLIIILLVSFSCNKTKTTQEVAEISDTLNLNSDRIVNTISETLIPKAKKAVSEWKEYQHVDEILLKYYNVSNFEALDYAEELSGLVQAMKDTIRVENLKEPSIKARFNVLYSETLRLTDMATIPSISSEEVEEEVSRIIEVYSAINSKINTIYKVEEFQKSLEVDTEAPVELIDESLNLRYRNKNLKDQIIKKKDRKLIPSKKTE